MGDGERETMSVKHVKPSFSEWWQEVVMHAVARDIDIDFDQELWREDYENGLEPWEAVEG
jgi:hypothetical protein